MKEGIPSKYEILIETFQLQQASPALLLQSEQYKNEGNLDAAITAYGQLIDNFKEQIKLAMLNNEHYPDTPLDVTLLVNPMLNAMMTLADVNETMGDLEKAEELREKAIALSEEHLFQSETRERERQRASSLISQGRFNEALVILNSARDHFREKENYLAMAGVTADIAGILEWLGDFERALVEVKEASRFIEPMISGKEISETDIASVLSNGRLEEAQDQAKLLRISLELEQIQARINRCLGNFFEATSQFKKIIYRVPSVARPAIEFQLAAILVCDGNYKEGLDYVKRLEPAFRGLLRPKLGVLLKFKAEALLGLGNPDEALPLLDEAIEDLSTYKDPDSLWKVQWLRARVLDIIHRPDEALKAFTQTAETINNLRKAPLGYRLDSIYLRDKLPAIEEAITLACQNNEAEACCHFMELIKSRTLTATLTIPDSIQEKYTSDLERRADELTRQINAMEYSIYRNELSEEVEQRRTSLLSERTEVMEQIRFSDPRWRAMSEPIPFELESTLSLLAKREQAVLTLHYQPHKVVAVLLYEGKCSVAATMVSTEAKAALSRYQHNLQSSEPRPQWYDPSAALNMEAEHFVAPNLLKEALKAKSLVIVPHGPLHLLPWAGLNFEGKRLFEYSPVGILPNLSCLPILEADFPPSPHIGLIGAPDYDLLPAIGSLNFAPEELHTIKDIYSPSKRVIADIRIGAAATTGAFWELNKDKDSAGNILHIACHGDFETGNPMNSGLLLTDAKIDAMEIARSRMRYNEVILSACNTGYRPMEAHGVKLSGDDILGLPGAFLEAGVSSVLVSIPLARDDATLAFMTIYHENRSEGKTPLFAIQETQKSMLLNPLYPPYLWIGFVVYGAQ